MEFFIEQIRLILPVLGFEFLRSKPKRFQPDNAESRIAGSKAENPVFEITVSKKKMESESAGC